jgi:hypothetical protein
MGIMITQAYSLLELKPENIELLFMATEFEFQRLNIMECFVHLRMKDSQRSKDFVYFNQRLVKVLNGNLWNLPCVKGYYINRWLIDNGEGKIKK